MCKYMIPLALCVVSSAIRSLLRPFRLGLGAILAPTGHGSLFADRAEFFAREILCALLPAVRASALKELQHIVHTVEPSFSRHSLNNNA